MTSATSCTGWLKHIRFTNMPLRVAQGVVKKIFDETEVPHKKKMKKHKAATGNKQVTLVKTIAQDGVKSKTVHVWLSGGLNVPADMEELWKMINEGTMEMNPDADEDEKAGGPPGGRRSGSSRIIISNE